MLKKKFFKTKDECEVAFEIELAEASKVELVCENNGWQPVPMKKGKTGTFRTRVRLPKESRIQFRYLVDGNVWVNDETADAVMMNEFGIENSVIDTAPKP